MTSWLNPSPLDRLALGRSMVDAAAHWPTALLVEIDAHGNIAADDGRPTVRRLEGEPRPTDVLIGRVDGQAWYARPVAKVAGESVGWRAVRDHVEQLAAGVVLSRWHLQEPRCEACGGPTQPDLLGARRACSDCGALLFARTDPCVIVAITDPDDRLLLARQGSWPAGRMSIIAGFLEAGESAEQACHREVFEEVGVRLTELAYVSSQPWPMPRSLMLGFRARTDATTVTVDGEEIVEGAFHERSEVLSAVREGTLTLPGRASIARDLIEAWLAG